MHVAIQSSTTVTCPGFETHTTFWSGRKFDVLLVSAKGVDAACWVGDRFMKWNLMAEIKQESLHMGCGSLVHIIIQTRKRVEMSELYT